MSESGSSTVRANAALVTATNAGSLAQQALTAASNPASTTVFASAFGVVADGITACDTALYNAINAAQTAASTSADAQFCEVVLPAGKIRITRPLVVMNNLTSTQFRLRGAGSNASVLYADFFTTSTPTLTVSGGAGSGAVLYPVIERGTLVAVVVIAGGSGFTSAPSVTLNAATGSGATCACTINGGAITGVTVTAGGNGYPPNYSGDAVVVRGQMTDLSNFSVISSPARTAAGNGGPTAYPYFMLNNGIRYEPLTSYAQTVALNALERMVVKGQPGHGINAARQEQWAVTQVQTAGNGADGLFLHTQGYPAGSYGIANAINQFRANNNGCRGMHVEGMETSSYSDFSIFTNMAAASLPNGVNEEIYFANSHAQRIFGDVEQNTGSATGHDLIRIAGCYAPQIGGYFRGGRFGIYFAACRATAVSSIMHSGNPGDASNAAVFYDSATGGSNSAKWAPSTGPIYLLGNVNLTVNRDAASIYAYGVENGILRYVAMQGGQYQATASTTIAPDPINNGTDQVFSLTGNVTANAPVSSANGLHLRLIFAQDATGGRSLAFNSTAYPGIGTIAGGTSQQIGILDLQCVIAGGRTVWIRKSWSGWV